MSIPGIDLSSYQNPVNWANLAECGIKFAFLKATEGVTWKDPTFTDKWKQAKSVGILRGAYHFFRPNKDASEQADNFLNSLNAVGGLEANDLPPVLDTEANNSVGSSVIRSRWLEWLKIVEQKSGRKPILYTYPSFWNGLGSTPEFKAYPLWIAHYRLGRPDIPGAWTTCYFWQYTDQGRIKGISDYVDLNWFNGELEGLQKFVQGDFSRINPDPIFTDLINRKDTGESVKEIQRLLGFQGDDVDGKFVPMTEGRVVEFQRSHDLPVNGIVDPATLAKLKNQ